LLAVPPTNSNQVVTPSLRQAGGVRPPTTMSIYQSRTKRPIINDVSRFDARSNRVAPARTPSSGQGGKQDWQMSRKVEPANHLLPLSVKWLGDLPQGVRPKALTSRYPRIVNLLALEWSKPTACSAYLDDLLTDRRSNRQGFPADVYSELLVLQDYYCSNLGLKLEE
jgi:hypothetical protein